MINLFVIAGQYSIVIYIYIYIYIYIVWLYYVQNVNLKILVNNEDLIDRQKLGFWTKTFSHNSQNSWSSNPVLETHRVGFPRAFHRHLSFNPKTLHLFK